MGGMRELTSGACGAWSLPVDASCAAAARALYREAAAAAGLGASLAYDGIMMASELAANTLHAEVGRAGLGGRSEFWLYLRGSGVSRELVCKVFDALPGWPAGAAPTPSPAQVPQEATGGRGLQVVHELSGGRWGHHLTRARLGRLKCRGKAVWFALPAPPDLGAWPAARDGGEAAERLHAMLSARGLGDRLRRADQPAAGRSVLWMAHALAVSCRDGTVCIEIPGRTETPGRPGPYHWTYADLVDVSERAVWMYEELEYVGR